MPERCVVFGCSNTANTAEGVCLYQIPFWDDNSPLKAKRRQRWVNFVRRRRAKWTPTHASVVCSKHFTKDCFVYGSDTVPRYPTPKLKRDENGICVFPTLDTDHHTQSGESKRTKRASRRDALAKVNSKLAFHPHILIFMDLCILVRIF